MRSIGLLVCLFSVTLIYAQSEEVFTVKRLIADTTYKIYCAQKVFVDTGTFGRPAKVSYTYLYIFANNKALLVTGKYSPNKERFLSYQDAIMGSSDLANRGDTIHFTYQLENVAGQFTFEGINRQKRIDATIQCSDPVTGNLEKNYYWYYRIYKN